jgi:DNA modification methylase
MDKTEVKPWENRIIGLEMLSPEKLSPNPLNFRGHPADQKAALTGALNTLGWVQTVVMNKTTGRIIDGHLRVALALARKEATIPVTIVELTEAEEAQALLSLDPIAAMAETEREKMAELMALVQTDDEQVMQYLEALAKENSLMPAKSDVEDVEPDLDKAQELLKKWGVQPGDLWQLGDNHRLICGDCTDPATVARLMAGQLAQMCWTDPPWNVDYGENLDKDNAQGYKVRKIANDNLGEKFPAFAAAFCGIIHINLQPGGLIYMVMSAQEWPVIDQSLRDAGFHWSSTIIWNKDHPVLSRKDYHTKYEPIWYGWRDDGPRLAILTDRKQSDVWDFDRPTRSDDHPTMKPLGLVERAIVNSSKRGDLVFEPFAGSGPVVIACEKNGRRSNNIELDPAYCSVILERWLLATGIQPEKLN